MITTSITVNILVLNGSEIVIYSLKWIEGKKVFFSSLLVLFVISFHLCKWK